MIALLVIKMEPKRFVAMPSPTLDSNTTPDALLRVRFFCVATPLRRVCLNRTVPELLIVELSDKLTALLKTTFPLAIVIAKPEPPLTPRFTAPAEANSEKVFACKLPLNVTLPPA